MKVKIIILLVCFAILSGCGPKKRIINIEGQFDKSEAAYIFNTGKNTIKGNAFLRQQGGGVVTCAGFEAFLVPVTKYSTERIQKIYNSTEKGYNDYFLTKNTEFVPDSIEYRKYEKKTQCNSEGKFIFENISDGEYYVISGVVWSVGYNVNGGVLMQKVSVRGGETKEVILTY